jgi:hypothetical protein
VINHLLEMILDKSRNAVDSNFGRVRVREFLLDYLKGWRREYIVSKIESEYESRGRDHFRRYLYIIQILSMQYPDFTLILPSRHPGRASSRRRRSPARSGREMLDRSAQNPALSPPIIIFIV